jgi:hypothetical protein
MLLSLNQPKINTKNINNAANKNESKSNWVMTIDLSKPVKILDTILCCLEAGLINGRKYNKI